MDSQTSAEDHEQGVAAPISETDALLSSNPPDELLLQHFLGLKADEHFALRKPAAQIHDWLFWLTTRKNALQQASDLEQLESLIRKWHRALDFYLWADPGEDLPAEGGEALDQLLGNSYTRLIKRLEDHQGELRAYLASRNITRITTEPGQRFIAGVLEVSALPSEPTNNPSLDSRVYEIALGEGGYRSGNQVIVTAYARRFCFEAPVEP